MRLPRLRLLHIFQCKILIIYQLLMKLFGNYLYFGITCNRQNQNPTKLWNTLNCFKAWFELVSSMSCIFFVFDKSSLWAFFCYSFFFFLWLFIPAFLLSPKVKAYITCVMLIFFCVVQYSVFSRNYVSDSVSECFCKSFKRLLLVCIIR